MHECEGTKPMESLEQLCCVWNINWILTVWPDVVHHPTLKLLLTNWLCSSRVATYRQKWWAERSSLVSTVKKVGLCSHLKSTCSANPTANDKLLGCPSRYRPKRMLPQPRSPECSWLTFLDFKILRIFPNIKLIRKLIFSGQNDAHFHSHHG